MMDAMVSSGCVAAGLNWFWQDDGWETNVNGRVQAYTPAFQHGISYLSDYAHARGIKLLLYVPLMSRSPETTAPI